MATMEPNTTMTNKVIGNVSPVWGIVSCGAGVEVGAGVCTGVGQVWEPE